jgi:short subunit dehydrogenase-like uncharacterized protein
MTERPFDLIVYGASGFVGRQAVEYVANHEQALSLRLAIAGRDRRKLEAIGSLLGEQAGRVDILVADANDREALDKLAAKTRVVLNAAGPFALYGDAVVDACVARGTHYVDITGETVWVRGLIDRHHARAAHDGTRIIPCCGFDSVPSDLGAYLIARQVQRELGVPCVEVRAYFQMYGGFNGGTLASNFNRYESGQVDAGRDPFLLNPRPVRVRKEIERNADPVAARYDGVIGTWVGPFIMGPINTRVVRRSAALLAEWDGPYGAGFRYQEYTKFDPPLAHLKAAALTGAMRGFERLAAHQRPRALLKQLLPAPGSGPSERTMNEGWFRTELVGFSEDGDTLRGLIAHQGDPGNRATVRFVCESALALVFDQDELPGGAKRGGLLTPSTGLGEVLARRLRAAGVLIAVGQ